MKRSILVPVLAAVALMASVPAFACDGANKSSATAASAGHGSCSASARSTAWAGAWLQRTASGACEVAAVAEGSPAARQGLRAGDVVLAVNGHALNAANMSCPVGACSVGRTMAYTVQRGRNTRVVKLALEKMPASAAERFAHREASFDPALAAMVMPAAD